jgi:pyruvate/2-oxoglutarate dehydrogenase complex dihydrolipoamide dehydrogenase (E3) component
MRGRRRGEIQVTNVLVVGGGPAGLRAALRAAELGAKTTLVTSGEFGGMAANDGPIPVRTLAHAARLLRDAHQLGDYGVFIGQPVLDYSRLLTRVREVVAEVQEHSARRPEFDSLGITIHEKTGAVRFVDPHTVEAQNGIRLQADSIILCTGGVSRRLNVPGFELTSTHSDAWGLTAVPKSMLVIGGGDTGAQVASIFNAFGTKVQLLQAGARVLPLADEHVSAEVTRAFRDSGIEVRTNFGAIESFEKTSAGVRMNFSKDGVRDHAEAELAVVAVGWVANTSALELATAGVELDERGFVKTDDYLRTTATHIFAAGDVNGRLMLVPQALQEGFVAAINAVQGPSVAYGDVVSPVGSFTAPEYAQVGLTEAKAREKHDALGTVVRFDSVARPIIDGRKVGLCKLVTDRASYKILGCHIVGERAVEIAQVAAIAISAGLRVNDLLRIPLSFPTYTGVLVRAAALAASELQLEVRWDAQ